MCGKNEGAEGIKSADGPPLSSSVVTKASLSLRSGLEWCIQVCGAQEALSSLDDLTGLPSQDLCFSDERFLISLNGRTDNHYKNTNKIHINCAVEKQRKA